LSGLHGLAARTAALAALLFSLPCVASEPLAPLLGCRALTDPTARLACFDRESAHLDAAPVAPAAPAAVRPAQSKENFGLPDAAIAKKEVAAGTRAADLPAIDAHITHVSVSADGQATFTLDNGQVWRQLLAEGDLLAAPGEPVTLSRGVFNSYWLRLKTGRGCKVTRIR
jgi:hypothetical protein